MKCPKCQQEIDDNSKFCNHCGAAVEQDSVSEPQAATQKKEEPTFWFEKEESSNPRKPHNNEWRNAGIALIGLFVVVIVLIIAAKYTESDSSLVANSSVSTETEEPVSSNFYSYYDSEDDEEEEDEYDGYDDEEDDEEEEPETFKYKAKLSCGFYYTGYNIPKGTYNLKWISGSGNVISNELNEIFGSDKSFGSIKKYKNLDLTETDCLEVKGDVVIQITSSDAIKKQEESSNKAKKKYTFSSGNYKCSKHIKRGMYDITLVNGSGNVFIGDKVNEVFGPSKSFSQIKKIKNVILSDGEKIEISGCTIKFSPTKVKFEKNIY